MIRSPLILTNPTEHPRSACLIGVLIHGRGNNPQQKVGRNYISSPTKSQQQQQQQEQQEQEQEEQEEQEGALF